jgi:cyclophilin family peptidyl-prolyl cis-trans isomerase
MTPASLRRFAAPLAGLAIAVSLVGCSTAGGGSTASAGPIETTAPTGAPSEGAGATCPTTQPAALPAGETRIVTIATDLGEIVIGVEADLSPIAAGNFVALAECGYYDGVVFHRAATMGDGTPFVIQGGDPTGTGTGGPGYQTVDAPPADTRYTTGTVAMAKGATDPPGTSGSQFFVVTAPDAGLPPEYAVVGTVTEGMETVSAIEALGTGDGPPSQPVVIEKVTVEES